MCAKTFDSTYLLCFDQWLVTWISSSLAPWLIACMAKPLQNNWFKPQWTWMTSTDLMPKGNSNLWCSEISSRASWNICFCRNQQYQFLWSDLVEVHQDFWYLWRLDVGIYVACYFWNKEILMEGEKYRSDKQLAESPASHWKLNRKDVMIWFGIWMKQTQ